MSMKPPICPECGSALDIDPKCVIEEPYLPGYVLRNGDMPRRTRVAPAALCTGCEFAIEITTPRGYRLDTNLVHVRS